MATFSLTRATHVNAPLAQVHGLVDDFRRWVDWSPWENLDPNLQRVYSGADSGVGAHYAWTGTAKAGQGTMEITESSPAAISVDLTFLKPFKARNVSRFDFSSDTEGTTVVWTMTGERNLLMQWMGRMYFDKAIARDFERGLAQLKSVAEAGG